MEILALDLAKINSVALMMNTDTGEYQFETIPTTPSAVEELVDRKRPDRLVLEVGAAAGWVHDLGVSRGIEVQVANPNGEAWKWRSIKRKTDRDDAMKLVSLSVMGQLPTVHVPSPEVRQMRAFIGYNQKLVTRRTAIKCQIHAILQRQGLRFPSGKAAWNQESMKRLQELAAPLEQLDELDLWRGQLSLELTALDQIEQQVAQVRKKLDALGKQNERVQLVQTIPGVGPRLAEAIVAVIDDPKRFRNGKQVSNYLGMVPRLYESGQMSRNGHITRAGNPMLRSLLVEVSWLALRWNPYLAQTYQRIRGNGKRRGKVAIVATARRLLVIAWAMLRDNKPWCMPKLSAA